MKIKHLELVAMLIAVFLFFVMLAGTRYLYDNFEVKRKHKECVKPVEGYLSDTTNKMITKLKPRIFSPILDSLRYTQPDSIATQKVNDSLNLYRLMYSDYHVNIMERPLLEFKKSRKILELHVIHRDGGKEFSSVYDDFHIVIGNVEKIVYSDMIGKYMIDLYCKKEK